MHTKIFAEWVKITGSKYSCRWDARICTSQLEFSINIEARKGKTSSKFIRNISWLKQIENKYWDRDLMADIHVWFNFYFIMKNDFSVRSEHDKRIRRE